jgi:hypothetical protein
MRADLHCGHDEGLWPIKMHEIKGTKFLC